MIKYTYQYTQFESSYYAILSLCEVEVYGCLPLCDSIPCSNGGTCYLKYDSYECLCPVAMTGITCEEKRMSQLRNVIIGASVVVGVVAVGTGAVVGGAGWCTAGAAAHSGDIASQFGVIGVSKALRTGVGGHVLGVFDDEEDDDDDEEEDLTLWDSVCQTVSSIVEELSNAVNPQPPDSEAPDQQSE